VVGASQPGNVGDDLRILVAEGKAVLIDAGSRVVESKGVDDLFEAVPQLAMRATFCRQTRSPSFSMVTLRMVSLKAPISDWLWTIG
jgi:hypothetical protein